MMIEKGLECEHVIKILEEMRKNHDYLYERDIILNSMCTSLNPCTVQAHSLFLDTNLIDSILFPSLRILEKQVIQQLGTLLHNENAVGNFVTGGTEANLMALWIARKIKHCSKTARSKIVIAKSAHYSIQKVADVLRLETKVVKLDKSLRMDSESVRRSIDKNTIAVVATAGTSDLGVIDPIEEIADICRDEHIYFHVDAAFGGFVLPFLRELGYTATKFDFEIEGVSSVSIDPHKMGISIIPSGIILFRNKELLDNVKTKSSYSGRYHSTFSGSRNGASVAATFATIMNMGRNGYREVVKRCMKMTNQLIDDLSRIGLKATLDPPPMNIVGINMRKPSKVIAALREERVIVSKAKVKRALRVVLMPHVKIEHIEYFVKCLKELRGRGIIK